MGQKRLVVLGQLRKDGEHSGISRVGKLAMNEIIPLAKASRIKELLSTLVDGGG
ncbi:MAG: hypothetical protein P9F19_17670 [Candidatus Contendobacter sp.]|nr:hypothetical protein [Candidatus Contendobacter sp.]MDG4559195.1 hypothetical protein [Candidatus Contendobacter sp.]